MAKLELEPGERELHREPVSFRRRGALVPGAQLVLTDRRVMRVIGAPGRFAFRARAKVDAQIRRERYAGLELVWSRPTESFFVLWSTDVLVARVAIDVIAATPATEWRDRLERWRDGVFGPVELPKATLVKE